MRSDSSEVLYRRKFHPQNLDNLLKIKQKRYNITNKPTSSAPTLPRFIRPSSESRYVPSRITPSSREKSASQEKLYNKLSTQLKEIKQSISSLASQRRKKKPSKYKSKVITEVSEEDPKTKIYQQVLRQIKEIKQSKSNFYPPPPRQLRSPQPRRELKPIDRNDRSNIDVEKRSNIDVEKRSNIDVEKTLFYGVDFIEGVQFKIKVKLGNEKYCLMAKNNFTKMMMEMPAKEYLALNSALFHGNPCAIFKYISIEKSNRLRLKKIHSKANYSEVRSYVDHY